MDDDDRIFRAANSVLTRGVKPSWTNVREQLGGGSKTTLVPALRRYWKERGWRSLVVTPAVPIIPAPPMAPVAPTMVPREDMERALALAEERAHDERQRLMLELDGLRQRQREPQRPAPAPVIEPPVAGNVTAEVERLQRMVGGLMAANARLAASHGQLEIEVSDLRCALQARASGPDAK